MIRIRQRSLVWTWAATITLVTAAPAWAGGFPGGHQEVFGPHFQPLPHRPPPPRRPPDGAGTVARIRYWNEVMLAANALDHTPVAPGENRVFGEQVGPCRTARAFAIVHIAVFDAVNAIVGGYESYTGLARQRNGASLDAAVAQAAHDTLVALYPSQTTQFDRLLAEELRRLKHRRAIWEGSAIGAQAAAAILALREEDGSDHQEPRIGIEYIPSDAPGQWRQDPVSLSPLALGAYWGQVKPFALRFGNQFRVPSPPSLPSLVYAEAFREVKRLGGDGITTPTERDAEQTAVGIAWAYDGTPGLGAPPREYNQIAVTVADIMQADALELARLLALVNVAMADAAIAAWESKYYFKFWRPVTAIREADSGTGPSGSGDGNPRTIATPDFTPLGAPASNLLGPNFTPPFPAYPSGHAVFGAVTFETLRHVYGNDDIAFTFFSDEFNGETRDNTGEIRARRTFPYDTLSEAEEENGQSRIYLGIHWAFDKAEGIVQGRRVANYVFEHVFQPQKPCATRYDKGGCRPRWERPNGDSRNDVMPERAAEEGRDD